MASSFSNLGFELMADGEKANTWGAITNENWQMTEEALTGTAEISISDDYTLSSYSDGAPGNNARKFFLRFIGTISANKTVTLPTNDKVYGVQNATTGGYALQFSSGSGDNVSVENGKSTIIHTAVSGQHCRELSNSGGITDIVADTTPSLGGNLDVNAKQITSASNGNIVLKPNGTGSVQLQGDGGSTGGSLRFTDNDDSNHVTIKVPATVSASYTLTLPADDGSSSGQVLQTNGSGVLSWATLSSGSTYAAGTGLDLNGSTFSVTASYITGLISSNSPVTGVVSGSSLAMSGTSVQMNVSAWSNGQPPIGGFVWGTGGQVSLTAGSTTTTSLQLGGVVTGTDGIDDGLTSSYRTGTVVAGTYRAMGTVPTSNSSWSGNRYTYTLWQRIA